MSRLKETKKIQTSGGPAWEALSKDNGVSGIEFRDGDTLELVSFIAIRHTDILEPQQVFRITIKVNKDGEFGMPAKKTFEETIQAKRRFQQLLYGSGASSNSSSVLSERAARRVAAAARRRNLGSVSSSSANRSLPTQPVNRNMPPPSSRSNRSRKRNSSRRRTTLGSSARRKSALNDSLTTQSEHNAHEGSATSNAPDLSSTGGDPVPPPPPPPPPPPVAASSPVKLNTIADSHPLKTATPPRASGGGASPKKNVQSPIKVNGELSPSTSSARTSTAMSDTSSTGDPKPIVTSLKELKNHHLLGLDANEIKRIKSMLKMAPPGATIMLANGTMIKKSRRGGARAGAGRKRSRPEPTGNSQPTA